MFINLTPEEKAARIKEMLIYRQEMKTLLENRKEISQKIDDLDYKMRNLVPYPEEYDDQGNQISPNLSYCNCKRTYPGCCSFSKKD